MQTVMIKILILILFFNSTPMFSFSQLTWDVHTLLKVTKAIVLRKNTKGRSLKNLKENTRSSKAWKETNKLKQNKLYPLLLVHDVHVFSTAAFLQKNMFNSLKFDIFF